MSKIKVAIEPGDAVLILKDVILDDGLEGLECRTILGESADLAYERDGTLAENALVHAVRAVQEFIHERTRIELLAQQNTKGFQDDEDFTK